MVYLPTLHHGDCLKCYLVTSFTDDELKAFKSAFGLGACSRFSPLMELKLVDTPEDYIGKSHQYMRAKENEAGNNDPFVVVDDEAKSRGAVWYIEQFAEEDHVEDGEAESTDVVFKILIQTEALAMAHINSAIANSSISEDLLNCSVDLPLTNDFHQPDLHDCGGFDWEEEQWHQDAYVTAEPGEFEESTDPELLNNFVPRPDKVARLKEDVAKAVGLISSWMIPGKAEPFDLEDGTRIEFPEGSVVLQQRYNPEHPWPEVQ
ncbi:hypothetical protein FBEOM_4169 [Fusarium beomiforme]|uniref:Uncharacterized protein n=1 Tax=Fusarium beomiforme TaxID=44412 RepID=A0A9P5AN99_9HYPO|nr:hypothetical protein FBEOM_4169 [Fusarium beomiforme]